jgi:hypothetical protein
MRPVGRERQVCVALVTWREKHQEDGTLSIAINPKNERKKDWIEKKSDGYPESKTPWSDSRSYGDHERTSD